MDSADRAEFLAERRRIGPVRMDTLYAVAYDESWGEVSGTHHTFVQRLIDSTPKGGLLLDAACGTGKYWPQILAASRRVIGTDRSAGMLAQAHAKFPQVETRQLDMEQLGGEADLAGRFNGLLCVDAMENIPPEDWPAILTGFRAVVRPRSLVYVTVEIPEPADVRAAANPKPPLVRGEVLWPDEHGGGYHFYPDDDQVGRWCEEADLAIVDSDTGGGYHHVLARTPD